MSLKAFETDHLRINQHEQAIVASVAVPDPLGDDSNLDEPGRDLSMRDERQGCRKLIVGLEGSKYLTRSGIGKLITLHRKMHRLQGIVVFCDILEPVMNILKTSKLNTYFRIAPNIDSAMCEIGAK